MLTTEQKQELKSKYGEVVYAKYPDGEFLFRSPTEEAFSRWSSSIGREKADRLTVFKQLCIDCLVYPERDGKPDYAKLESLFQRKPALPLTIGGELTEAAGAAEDAPVGKL